MERNDLRNCFLLLLSHLFFPSGELLGAPPLPAIQKDELIALIESHQSTVSRLQIGYTLIGSQNRFVNFQKPTHPLDFYSPDYLEYVKSALVAPLKEKDDEQSVPPIERESCIDLKSGAQYLKEMQVLNALMMRPLPGSTPNQEPAAQRLAFHPMPASFVQSFSCSITSSSPHIPMTPKLVLVARLHY